MHLVLAVLLAVGAALAFAVSTVGQQRAAERTSDEAARNGSFFLHLLRDKQWLAATLGTATGFALQGAALGIGSVLLVQPILVTSLLFALPLSARLAHRRLPGRVIAVGVLLASSLAVFEVLGDGNHGVDHGSLLGWVMVTALGAPVVLACLLVARTRTGATRSGLLALAVGVLGGALAILTKSVVDAAASHGVLSLIGNGEFYGLLVVGLGGVYLQQLAFQAGSLQTSLPVMTVVEPLTAAVLGLTLLHESLDAGAVRTTVLVTCAVLATGATIALARVQSRTTPTPAPERIPALV